MNDQAREALGRVIRAYGPSICHTPRSCEFFVRQECAAYPEETRVLVEALRHGVATELVRYQPAERPWDAFSGDLQKQLTTKAGLDDPQGTWAIDAWARVLGRHPEAWSQAPEVVAGDAPQQQSVASRASIATAMTVIVGSGGALGTALGAVFEPAALLITTVSTTLPFMDEPVRKGSKGGIWLIVALVLIVIALIGAAGGGLGAALGWVYGKGDRGHWRGFVVTFSAGFTSATLAGHFLGILGWFLVAGLTTFIAARTCASRGGFV